MENTDEQESLVGKVIQYREKATYPHSMVAALLVLPHRIGRRALSCTVFPVFGSTCMEYVTENIDLRLSAQ